MNGVWQPGDLVMVPFEAGHRMLLVTEYGGVFSDGYGVEEKMVREFADVRPLVVIDPEDREQVERLTSLLGWALAPSDAAQLADALREFADPKPPKPAEPTGLGAVVEDADGHKWTRANNAGEWFCECGDDVETSWSNLPAVKVISEGVSL